jgi:hypothetical protein
VSFDASLWAMKDAPAADVEEWAVLVVMAESADDDGCNAFQSTKTIAKRTRLSERTVQRRMDEMEARGVTRLGDPNDPRLLKIPEHLRPTNYDLQIPYAWFGSSIGRINGDRAKWGRPPLQPEERPLLAEAPPKKARADKGKPKPQKDAENSVGEVAERDSDCKTPGDYKTPGDLQTDESDQQSPHGVSGSHPNLSSNPPQDPVQKDNLFSLRSKDEASKVNGKQSTDADPASADVKPDLKFVRGGVGGDGPERSTAQGHRLPEDWLPSEDVRQWTLKECPLVRKPDLEEFRDYWKSQPGIKGRKVDWDATWRNWCRKAQRDRTGGGRMAAGGAPMNAHRPTGDIAEQNRAKWARRGHSGSPQQ